MPFTLIAAACVAGALSAAIALARPDLYLRLADRVNWRFGWPAPAQERLESTLERVHLRGDPLVGPGSTLLFGDSHLHGLPATALNAVVVNYAISGETAASLSERIGRYGSVARASRIILLTGQNDLVRGSDDASIASAVTVILQRIPAPTAVVLLGLLPASESATAVARRTRLNERLQHICGMRPGCRFVSATTLATASGSLDDRYAERDGIHLSTDGYRVLSSMLAPALAATERSQ